MSTYGCFNRKPFLPHVLLDGDYHLEDGILTREVIKIPFRMSQDCNYAFSEYGRDDPKCTGCRWKVPAP